MISDFELQEKMRAYYENIYMSHKNIETFSKFTDSQFIIYRISKVLSIYRPNKEERVLDLGCGLGTICFAMALFCKEITGVDYSKKAIDVCNRFLKENPYDHIKFVCADAQDTGLESARYDVIVCADLFEHLYPEVFERVLDECGRLLKVGGKLVIWTPHREHILEILKNHNIILKKDPGHVDYKSMHRLLISLRQRQFSIKKAYYDESHIRIFRNLEALLLPVLPMMRRRIAILAEKKID